MCRLLVLQVLGVWLAWQVGAVKRPIVGIMTQELETPGWRNYSSYLPATYVKATEAAGARVVPIFIKRPLSYYKEIMSRINGVVFPGGSANFHSHDGIADAGAIVYKIAKEMNRAGKVMPILGVCQGLELLAFLSNNRTDILIPCHAENLNLPLKFKPNFMNSSLYKMASDDIIYILKTLPVTSNHHQYCLTEKNLQKDGLLGSPWRVLSTNLDRNGLEFVSSMEAEDMPFVGVQFHPEKVTYEWSPSQENPHSGKAVAAARLFYDWLVGEARKSNSTFPDLESETDALIFNYSPIFTAKLNFYDTQTYYFY